MSKKTDQIEKLYHEALETLDGLHFAIVDFAELSGVKPREPLLADDGAKLPRSTFVAEGDDAPERGGMAFDTRMALALTRDQAETFVFELVRALREEESKEIELEIDGRLMLKRGAAADVRRVLEELDD